MSNNEVLASFIDALEATTNSDRLKIELVSPNQAKIVLAATEESYYCEMTDARVISYISINEPHSDLNESIIDTLKIDDISVELYQGERVISDITRADSIYFYSPLFEIRASKDLKRYTKLVNDAAQLFIDVAKKVDSPSYIEGAEIRSISKRYERSPTLRSRAVEFHGVNCSICDTNFETIYGDLGKGFIHIHHIIRVADSGIRSVNFETDLIPVCPNCHAMLHRRTPPLLPDELKTLLQGR